VSNIVEFLRAEAQRAKNEHGNTDFYAALRGAAATIEQLWTIRDAARALTEECRGGDLPPSLGALARLESALSVEWRGRKG
jgi:hypothetical protein